MIVSSLVLPLLFLVTLSNWRGGMVFAILCILWIFWQSTSHLVIYTSRVVLDTNGNLNYYRPRILWVKGSNYHVNLNDVKEAIFTIRESKAPIKSQASAFLMPVNTPSINFTLLNSEELIFRLQNLELNDALKVLTEIKSRFPKIKITNSLVK